MHLTHNFFDKLTRYSRIKPRELRAALITILVIAFAVSFRKWGIGREVDIGYGLSNFLGALIIVAISFFGRLYVQKIVGLGADFQAEYKLWTFGALLTLILVFITNGKLWFLITGGVTVYAMLGHRIGWVRYGLNHFGIGVVSLAGPIANIILAMIFRALHSVYQTELLYTGFILNIIWALWQIVPIPPTDGSRMFYGSRMVYMYGLAVVVSGAALLYSNIPVIITIPSVVVIGWIWWIVYYIVWERFNWGGPY